MHRPDYFKRIALSAAVLCVTVPGFSQTDVDRQTQAKELLDKGVNYYSGRNGYSRDYEKALDYLSQAAALDNADAQYALGLMYENGNGVEQDYAQAFEWYMKAAQKNSSRAQNSVAFFYDEGLGVDQSFVEAAKWYQKAADNNNGEAQFNLADMYAKGIGVEVDYDKSLELYRKAMTNGVREASREIPKVTSLKNAQAGGKTDFGEPVYVNPSVMPEFVGGNSGLLKYLKDNIVYPKYARENRIEGRVVISFIIGKDGYISLPEVVRSVSPDLDDEAVRVVSMMTNKWTPGYINGEPVNVRYSIPINFRLSR